MRGKSSIEVYKGHEQCEEKIKLLSKEFGFPNGLLPLKDIEECGIERETGFVWLKQKNSITHKFDKIGKLASYATQITAYAEKNKIKKLVGVKAKKLLWFTVSEIYLDEDPPNGKITFQAPFGLFMTFPVSAFHIEENKDNKLN